jgi:predicted nuclease of predicted toxin-antitoxin system
MKILFDQGTPAPLRRVLAEHVVDTAFERGWASLSNGDLLRTAEQDGYELFITTDQQLHDQQNLAHRKMGILVLMSTSWPLIQTRLDEIRQAVSRIAPGEYREVPI